MRKVLSEYGIELLKLAQDGNEMAEEQLIVLIRDEFMGRRIGRFMSRNRQVENEDLRAEFLIGMALNIHKAKLDMGDPIEFIIKQGVYRVRTYLRKHILQGTMQTCGECGNVSRLNTIGSQYICKKCGSSNNTTQEVNEYNDLAIENAIDKASAIEDEVIGQMMIEKFEETLTPGTNVTNVYLMIRDGVKQDLKVKNYIKYIAETWDCSEQNVVQNIEKLKARLLKYANGEGFTIKNGLFIEIEKKEGTNDGR